MGFTQLALDHSSLAVSRRGPDSHEENTQSLYRAVLNPDKDVEAFCPLQVLFKRFLCAQASFFDFEVLNKSRVQVLNVLLETTMYRKAIKHLVENPSDAIETKSHKPEVLPIRRGMLDFTFERCFRNLRQVDIPLAAIATQVSVHQPKVDARLKEKR